MCHVLGAVSSEKRLTRPRRSAENLPVATNYERAFAARPEVYAAWQQLNGAIKAGMDLRRYELATFAAAQLCFPRRWRGQCC